MRLLRPTIGPHKKRSALRVIPWWRFHRDQEGVTAVEFAILAPPFFLMIFGIIEFSLIMFVSTVMESSTNVGSRFGKTGYSSGSGTREQQIRSNILAHTGSILEASKLTISTSVYSNFNRVNQPEPCIVPPTPPCGGTPGVNFNDVNGNGTWDADMGSAGLGNAGDVVVYTASYPWKVSTPIINRIIGSIFTISARSVVRNEPYSVGAGGGR